MLISLECFVFQPAFGDSTHSKHWLKYALKKEKEKNLRQNWAKNSFLSLHPDVGWGFYLADAKSTPSFFLGLINSQKKTLLTGLGCKPQKTFFKEILLQFSCIIFLFNFFAQKMLNKHILTSFWSVQHTQTLVKIYNTSLLKISFIMTGNLVFDIQMCKKLNGYYFWRFTNLYYAWKNQDTFNLGFN